MFIDRKLIQRDDNGVPRCMARFNRHSSNLKHWTSQVIQRVPQRGISFCYFIGSFTGNPLYVKDLNRSFKFGTLFVNGTNVVLKRWNAYTHTDTERATEKRWFRAPNTNFSTEIQKFRTTFHNSRNVTNNPCTFEDIGAIRLQFHTTFIHFICLFFLLMVASSQASLFDQPSLVPSCGAHCTNKQIRFYGITESPPSANI